MHGRDIAGPLAGASFLCFQQVPETGSRWHITGAPFVGRQHAFVDEWD